MTDPTDLFRPDGGDDPLERELRRSLAAHAADAPDARALTERLLTVGSVGDRPAGVTPLRARTWRTWGTPLVAAACVAAIAGILLAIVQPGHSSHGPDAADTRSASVPSVVTPAPTAPTGTSSSPSPSSAVTTTTNGAVTRLRGLQVVDLTFQSATSGWALASADCLSGPGRCTAVLRTTDGTTWSSFPNLTHFDVPDVTAGCPATKCVSHIRFADASVGYAFGPQALYMTVNGGRSWEKQSGGADALETLNGNVIRVSALDTASPTLLTAPVRGTHWTSHSTARFPADPVAVSLSRSAGTAVLAFSQYDVATGNGAGQSGVLLRSNDDGATWKSSGDPCSSLGAGHSNVLVTATTAADSSVVVDCAGRSTTGPSTPTGRTITSTDGGVTFDTPPHGGALAPARFAGAASSAVQLLVPAGSTGLYRSTDEGDTWTVVPGVTVSGEVRFLGFEGTAVGRLVTDSGRTVWTTRNAGATWTRATL